VNRPRVGDPPLARTIRVEPPRLRPTHHPWVPYHSPGPDSHTKPPRSVPSSRPRAHRHAQRSGSACGFAAAPSLSRTWPGGWSVPGATACSSHPQAEGRFVARLQSCSSPAEESSTSPCRDCDGEPNVFPGSSSPSSSMRGDTLDIHRDLRACPSREFCSQGHPRGEMAKELQDVVGGEAALPSTFSPKVSLHAPRCGCQIEPTQKPARCRITIR
jgi:hypothetical protein